jgi:hypothetical protein
MPTPLAPGSKTYDNLPTLIINLSAPLPVGDVIEVYKNGVLVTGGDLVMVTPTSYKMLEPTDYVDAGATFPVQVIYQVKVSRPASNSGTMSPEIDIEILRWRVTSGQITASVLSGPLRVAVAINFPAHPLPLDTQVIVSRNGSVVGDATTANGGTTWTITDTAVTTGQTYYYSAQIVNGGQTSDEFNELEINT